MDLLKSKNKSMEFEKISKIQQDFFEENQEMFSEKQKYAGDSEDLRVLKHDLEDAFAPVDIEVSAQDLVKEHDITLVQNAAAVMEKNFAGYMEREEKEVMLPNLEEMKEAHAVKYETKVIKHTLKKDETVIEKVVEEKDRRLREKQGRRKLVSTAANELTDQRIKARYDVDIDIKKKMDFGTFEQLSAFSAYMDKDEFKRITRTYGEGVSRERTYNKDNAESVKEREKTREENLYPAMDVLTDVIMKMDPGSFDVSSDMAISRNARELEKMSQAVKSYESLLDKNQDYLTHMLSKNVSDDSDVTFGDRILKKLEELSAISNYYKLRKIVMEDDLYVTLADEEISMEEEAGDNIRMKNLKKNLRLSYYAGVHMQQVFNNVTILPETFKTKDAKAAVVTGRRMDYAVADILEKNPSLSRADAYKQYQKELKAQNQAVEKTAREQLLFAPKEQYDLLTLDASKQKKTPACGEYGGHLFHTVNKGMNTEDMVKHAGKLKLRSRYLDMKKKTGSKAWGESPKFMGGKDDYLQDVELSDNWDRLDMAYSTEYAYKKTDDEVMEMIDLLSIQKDTKKWNEIQNDPEKVAYYESAFKEMAMKNFEAIYGSVVRAGETVGMTALFMHPIDLIQQATMDLKLLLLPAAVVTNITAGNNPELIKKLFAENDPDGNFVFDLDDMLLMGGGMASINFKVVSASEMFQGITGLSETATSTEMFGYNAKKAMETEFNEYLESLKETGKNDEVKNLSKYTIEEKADWYVARHPELFSVKNLLRKKDGEFIFRNDLIKGASSSLQEAEEAITKFIKSGRVRIPTDEELKNYEKHLKDDGYCTLRNGKSDEVIAEYEEALQRKRNALKGAEEELANLKKGDVNSEKTKSKIANEETRIIKIKDEINDLSMAIKYQNESADKRAEEDPFCLDMIKSGFKESQYEVDGKQKFIHTMSVLTTLGGE